METELWRGWDEGKKEKQKVNQHLEPKRESALETNTWNDGDNSFQSWNTRWELNDK
jgi:hypothetical protein